MCKAIQTVTTLTASFTNDPSSNRHNLLQSGARGPYVEPRRNCYPPCGWVNRA
jgi:hypothetical protein